MYYYSDPVERIVRMASRSAVVIFSNNTCCMCHAVKRLFSGLGVSPTVYELDQDPIGREIERALVRILGNCPSVPVVFVGGKLVGSMDRVMAAHINGTLVPMLKEAGVKHDISVSQGNQPSDAAVSAKKELSDMVKSNTKKPTLQESHSTLSYEAQDGQQGAKSNKKKGKKGRQIDPALLGFKVTSNRIMMGEIHRADY